MKEDSNKSISFESTNEKSMQMLAQEFNRGFLETQTSFMDLRNSSPKKFSMTQKIKDSSSIQEKSNLLPSRIKSYDFQSRYLEAGLWPNVPRSEYKKLQKKYLDLKSQKKSLKQRFQTVRSKFRSLKKKPVVCKKCDEHRKKQAITEESLQEAVSLTQILLNEFHRISIE